MVALSGHWTNPENRKRLDEIRKSLNHSEKSQITIRDLTGRPENLPATKLLVNEVIPQVSSIVEYASVMIEFEKTRKSSQLSKSLLAALADFRGSLGFATAELKAYLISPEPRFKKLYQVLLQDNDRSFEKLRTLINSAHPY